MTRAEFESILDREFTHVYSFVAFRVAPDQEAAKDITQEVFLAAFRGMPSVQGGEGVMPAWLRGIARRKVADYYRKKSRFPKQIELNESLRDNCPRDNRDAILVSLAMRKLPGDAAGLLEDKYLQDLSVQEMAQARGKSEKAIESALTRARNAFRQAFSTLQSLEEH